MKYLLLLCAFLVAGAHAETVERLNQNVWNHGSENCEENQDPAIEIFQFDSDTYILRQNKCLDFEAPFIYVLFGNRKVFVQDTGATAEADRFPLYDTLRQLITERKEAKGKGPETLEILVTHSHSHSDHTAADLQFAGKPGVTLVAPDAESVRQYFAFGDWPNDSATIDLGPESPELDTEKGGDPIETPIGAALAAIDAWVTRRTNRSHEPPAKSTSQEWPSLPERTTRIATINNTRKTSTENFSHYSIPLKTSISQSVSGRLD